MKKGTYTLTGPITLRGIKSTTSRTVLCGETNNPADVIIDANKVTEALVLDYSTLVSGVTITNGITRKSIIKASGIHIGEAGRNAASTGLSVVSNCVVTCCSNNYFSFNLNGGGSGAVCVYSNGLLVDSTVTSNTSTASIAGVAVYGGEVRGCTISNNSAPYGGGMFVVTNATATVAGCTISKNTVSGKKSGTKTLDGWGGGLTAAKGSTLNCTDCRFEENSAANAGGGLCVSGAKKAEILGAVFDGNKITAGNSYGVGGAIAVTNQTDGASLMVSNCVFRNNTSSVNGRGGAFSGFFPGPVYAELVDCVFTNNTAYRQGGAVMVRDDVQSDTTTTRFRMRNCLVARNKTTLNSSTDGQARGAGVYLCAYANPVLESCTIVSNETASTVSGDAPGLFHVWGGTVTNCIIAFNTAAGKKDTNAKWCRYDSDGNPVTSAYRNCCVYPEFPGAFLADNGCLNEDPKFTDAAAGDYTLSSGSPCRDAGINMDWMQGARDLAGLRRISGSTVDIGCYEFFRQPGLAIIVR